MTRCPLQIKRERRLRDLENEADIEQDICDVTLWLMIKYGLKPCHLWVERHYTQRGHQIARVSVFDPSDHIERWTDAARNAFLALGYDIHDSGADIYGYEFCNGKHSKHEAIRAYARIERALATRDIHSLSEGPE